MMRMDENMICIGGSTAACRFAATYLTERGLPVTHQPNRNTGHLLLDVPSFGPDGQLRMGGDPESLLEQLPKNITIYGGNLNHPALQNYRTIDFLQDAGYLAENAYITAECALDVAMPYLTVTLRDCPVLIIGWGRIGKCLGKLLRSIGAWVTVAARKESDRAILQALGYRTVTPEHLPGILPEFRLLFNTVPTPILTAGQMCGCRDDCVCIELASVNGIEHENVITARGLPGIHLPESSGRLIAETFIRHHKKEASL